MWAPARADGIDELVAGMRAQQKGDHQGAISHLTLALDSAELSEQERAAALVKRGDSYYATSKQDLAHRDYSEAAILNPNHLQAVLSRGVTNYKKGNIDAAIADFDAAEAIAPRSAIRDIGQAAQRCPAGFSRPPEAGFFCAVAALSLAG